MGSLVPVLVLWGVSVDRRRVGGARAVRAAHITAGQRMGLCGSAHYL